MIVIYVDNILVGSLEVELHVRELVKVIEALTSAASNSNLLSASLGMRPLGLWVLWRQSLEMACQRRTGFRCKRNKGIYYWKFRCNQEGGG